MRPRKPRPPCPTCQAPVENLRSRYCSNSCQMESQYREYITRWKAGLETGNKGESEVSAHVRRYLFEKHGGQCERSDCRWGKRHPVTGKVPLTVNHKDGDWRKTTEDNIELLCPNCHALTPNYGSLNRGRGRTNRPGAMKMRGLSSVGRAPDLHSGGRRFEPGRLHFLVRPSQGPV